MTNRDTKLSYISLFSSGGIGDLGFKQADFECIATAELLSRRIEVQTLNEICKTDGYICGDINDDHVFNSILEKGENFQKKYKQPVTAVIATPPCQGMSVANLKKNNELKRNSLVVRSIEVIQKVQPLVFIFENVPAFIKTICTGLDGVDRPIGEEIERSLGGAYEYFSKTLQLADYGAPSSRTRSITIGVRNDLTWITPLDLFPKRKKALSLRELIGDLPSLGKMGEWDPSDPLHAFRPYKPEMRQWISGLQEGESAFDNADPLKRPHRIIDGKVVPNVRKSGDKYKRVFWDAIPPCVHTRNDILASQNTVHPTDDRVFSIRELMRMMGIPEDFKWFRVPDQTISDDEYGRLLAKNAMNIRQCLGEAVPVPVINSIAQSIATDLVSHMYIRAGKPRMKPETKWSTEAQRRSYNPVDRSTAKKFAAYYTQPLAAFSVCKKGLEALGKKRKYRILEPSVGAGVFLTVIRQMLSDAAYEIVALDIDRKALSHLRSEVSDTDESQQVKTICEDFLTDDSLGTFDLVIGNPPFGIPASKDLSLGKNADISACFVQKARDLSRVVSFVLPKAILHAERYRGIRERVAGSDRLTSITDFGELAFPNVKVETVGMTEKPYTPAASVLIKSWVTNEHIEQQQSYICPQEFPTWMIYRSPFIDRILEDASPGRLQVWRDRKLSRRYAVESSEEKSVKVIRGRNLSKEGSLQPDGRDYYVSESSAASTLEAISNLDGSVKLMAPNLSYFPRLVSYSATDNGNAVPDGSCAILYGELSGKETEAAIHFASSEENREFYRVACNRATRSINIDKSLAFWWLVPKC